MRRLIWFPVLAILVCLARCSSAGSGTDLKRLYERSAQYHGPERNPVIVIPGILGSRLVHPPSGKIVWGAFGGNFANPRVPEEQRLLALPMGLDAPLHDLRDDVQVDGALDRVEITFLGIPARVLPYAKILQTLGAGGYFDQQLFEAGVIDYGDDHFTCFQFAYDWRRDIAENAQLLHEFILERKEYVEGEIAARYGVQREVRFDIVAHSMGGLLARYFLRYGDADLSEAMTHESVPFSGAPYLNQLILVGTPNGGAARAFESLMQGQKYVPFYPRYRAPLLGTFPGVYQLLQRPRHRPVLDESGHRLDILDPDVWQSQQWGLASADADGDLEALLPELDSLERRRIALDHQRKCLDRARQFFEVMDRPASLPESVQLHLFAGDAEETTKTVQVGEDADLEVVATDLGDGTVLRSSTLLDERAAQSWAPRLISPIDWTSATFLFTDHLDLTRDPAFFDNVLHLLLEATH